jgi:hypothetical protein
MHIPLIIRKLRDSEDERVAASLFLPPLKWRMRMLHYEKDMDRTANETRIVDENAPGIGGCPNRP